MTITLLPIFITQLGGGGQQRRVHRRSWWRTSQGCFCFTTGQIRSAASIFHFFFFNFFNFFHFFNFSICVLLLHNRIDMVSSLDVFVHNKKTNFGNTMTHFFLHHWKIYVFQIIGEILFKLSAEISKADITLFMMIFPLKKQ